MQLDNVYDRFVNHGPLSNVLPNRRATKDEPEAVGISLMEKDMEEGSGELARNVRSTLNWQLPRSSRRWWWVGLGGLFSFVLVALFAHKAAPTIPLLQTSSHDALLDTVLNETLGFQKIFVINLKRQTDRKDRLQLAASLTGLKVEFMDAVYTDDVNWDAIPVVEDTFDVEKLKDKVWASWRSHVNAIEEIVKQNLGSALILEDDADWDIRVHDQLREWAKSSRQLVQPVARDHHQYLDPTYFKEDPIRYNQNMPESLRYTEWDVTSPPEPIVQPTDSAYGDLSRWDVLWLGHCGQRFAKPKTECLKTPLGRVTKMDDETVAETQYYRNWVSGYEYAKTYENHTRVTHWSCAQVCNTAYAISNQGAKKLLYDFGVRLFRGMSDAVLREICDGKDPYEMRTCVSVSPPLFNQYNLYQDKNFSHTANIRLSVNGNLQNLVNGDPPKDWYPDETPTKANGKP